MVIYINKIKHKNTHKGPKYVDHVRLGPKMYNCMNWTGWSKLQYSILYAVVYSDHTPANANVCDLYDSCLVSTVEPVQWALVV